MKKKAYIGNKHRYRKRFAKRVGSIALATTFVLGAPVATSSVSDSGFKNVVGPSVVHAATDNIVDFKDEKLQSSGEFTLGITSYQMGVHVEYPNFKDYDDMRVTWKIPDEMAVDLDEDEIADRIKGYSNVSGSYLDEDGNRVPSSSLGDTSSYISVNADDQTVEYNLSALMDDNNLQLDDSMGTPSNLLGLEIAAYNDVVPKGTYPVKVSVTEGPADPAEVAGAYTIDFEVDEGPEPEPEVDKDALEIAIEEANAFNSDDYTEESYNSLTSAVEKAEQVVGNDDATQDEVDAAAEKVNEAIDELVPVDQEPDVEKSELDSKLEEINNENLSKEDYTDSSWKALQDALAAADAVVADEEATQEEVDESLSALTDARSSLEDAPVDSVDKTELESKLEEINNENLSEENYTDSSWKALQDALAAADAVVADEEATQEEVDDSFSALTDARSSLEDAPLDSVDKTELESKLDGISNENLSREDYTDSSWETLQNALAAAYTVVANDDVTQDDVNASLSALTDAYDDLEKAVVTEPKPEPEDPEEEPKEEQEADDTDQDDSDVVVESDSDDGKTLPETATSTFNWIIGGLTVMLAGGAGLLISRRKRVNTK